MSTGPRWSPHVASILCDHRLSRLASPRLLKLRHILDHTVHPIPPRRVRIRQHPHAQNLGTALLAPDPSESQEEPLLRRVTVDLLPLFSSLVGGDHPL